MRRREVSPLELTDHYLERADRLDSVGAFVTLTPDLARDRAAELTADLLVSEPYSPLWGVPTAIKDLNLTAGVRTTFGSAAFADFVPDVSDGVTLSHRGGRDGQPRQDQHPGVRLALLHRARRRAPGGDALGPDPDGGRLVGRRRGRGRGRPGADRPGLRRRRVDPDPRLLLRARRPQAHAAGGSVVTPCTATRWVWARPGRSPGPCATRRRCSTCSPVVGWGILPGRHLLPRRSCRPATATRGGFGSLDSSNQSSPTLPSTPSACTAWEDASRLLESLGHEVVDIAVPMPREAVPTFETCWAVLTALSVVPPGEGAAAAAAHPLARRARTCRDAHRSSASRSGRCGGTRPRR